MLLADWLPVSPSPSLAPVNRMISVWLAQPRTEEEGTRLLWRMWGTASWGWTSRVTRLGNAMETVFELHAAAAGILIDSGLKFSQAAAYIYRAVRMSHVQSIHQLRTVNADVFKLTPEPALKHGNTKSSDVQLSHH